MKLTLGIIAAASMLAFSADVDCEAVYKKTLTAVEADKSSVLSIVTTQIEEQADCSCEIVKAAIVASEANKALVGDIVSAAIVASPDNMRLISQCAVAIAPDASSEVQKVLAKFAPQTGEGYSAKGGYSAKSPKGGVSPDEGGNAPINSPNPLDIPIAFTPAGTPGGVPGGVTPGGTSTPVPGGGAGGGGGTGGGGGGGGGGTFVPVDEEITPSDPANTDD